SALAFETFEQRGLFAADVGAGAHARLEIESLAAAGHMGAKISVIVRNFEGALELAECVRVFGANVDVAGRGPDGEGGDGHALDEHEGIPFHDHAVGVSSAVALVGVADDVFLVRGGVENRLPLYTCGG